MRHHITFLIILLLGGFPHLSCSNEQRNTSADLAAGSHASNAQLAERGAYEEPLDLGDDWDRSRAGTRQAHAGRAGNRRAASGARSANSQQEPRGPEWSVVLGTFSGENHAHMAHAFVQQLPTVSPDLAEARVRTTERGSIVHFGAFDGPDDPKAATALQWIKSIEHEQMPVFSRAFLTRITSPAERQSAQHPHALRSVRQLHPNVNPLYTLIVAAWSDFDSGQLSLEQVQKSAEQYAAELRSKGFEAYFHHDAGSGISTVTVGVFDRTAIDIESGMESAELRDLRRNFPVYLVNGEPVQELKNRRNPREGTRPQQPRLGVVPE